MMLSVNFVASVTLSSCDVVARLISFSKHRRNNVDRAPSFSDGGKP
jgi:hypothetical protein